MMNGLTITQFSPSDLEQVCHVFETAIPNAFEQDGIGHLTDDMRAEIEYKINTFRSAMDRDEPETCFWLAKREGVVVGTVSFGPSGEDIKACTGNQLEQVGELGSLYVLPDDQGQGIASALIREVVTYLHERGIEQFCLDSGYKSAQAKWTKKFGEPYVVVKDYWGPDTAHMVWLCSVVDFLD
ncbi:GNAT family N-acetyltransferase [Paenibacillus sp. P96]|uniref:GNAT family N-acetyltransferase n=1 Tax=Paenibacillus zeirhizosphaerae TaxID=2987519 RepID=A0ABT9FSW8_9BACL|nr:GNAT family N-acetyltransferase [Paenibacillus sp. P96]MDP4097780.1 GNAT family N-acetyltransferase [Paenibacillus sp. P96]